MIPILLLTILCLSTSQLCFSSENGRQFVQEGREKIRFVHIEIANNTQEELRGELVCSGNKTTGITELPWQISQHKILRPGHIVTLSLPVEDVHESNEEGFGYKTTASKLIVSSLVDSSTVYCTLAQPFSYAKFYRVRKDVEGSFILEKQ